MRNNNTAHMDFTFFNPLSSRQKKLLRLFAPINKLFERLRWHVEVAPRPANEDMITLEQRINLFHLENETLVHDVEGDLAEFGSHYGKTALMIQDMLVQSGKKKTFHVFDKFYTENGSKRPFKETFIRNFRNADLQLPVIHEGLFSETLPAQLPGKLSFVHIDCTTNPKDPGIADTVKYLLEHIYPRMSPHAICLIMDYEDPARTVRGSGSFPGVKEGCDAFFSDKPEQVHVLYGNQFPHGYFRKQSF
jgi:O-methyltransferase